MKRWHYRRATYFSGQVPRLGDRVYAYGGDPPNRVTGQIVKVNPATVDVKLDLGDTRRVYPHTLRIDIDTPAAPPKKEESQ